MTETTKARYYIQYRPGDGTWHYHQPRIGFSTEKTARVEIKELRPINSMGKKMVYRVVRVIETMTVL